jgi:hypothetical protein
MINRNPLQGKEYDLLLLRHTVIVNGQVVYVGEDWARAQQIFVWQVQSLALVQVKHIVQKQSVPVYHDPNKIIWDDVV